MGEDGVFSIVSWRKAGPSRPGRSGADESVGRRSRRGSSGYDVSSWARMPGDSVLPAWSAAAPPARRRRSSRACGRSGAGSPPLRAPACRCPGRHAGPLGQLPHAQAAFASQSPELVAVYRHTNRRPATPNAFKVSPLMVLPWSARDQATYRSKRETERAG